MVPGWLCVVFHVQAALDVHCGKRMKIRRLKKLNKHKSQMKKIEAVIRRTKFEETKEALIENGVEWFSYVEVRGAGHARNRRAYRGVIYETDIIERMMLILIVKDELCEKALDIIFQHARTGEIGDGRLWVSDIDHYYSIRTGRCDEAIKA